MADGGADRPPYASALAVGLWAHENSGYVKGRIALAGGDPDVLTLRRFIDVAFAILVEEYQRLGIDLLSALEKVGALGSSEPPEPVAPVPSAAENKQAMDQLMTMMGGVKGAPV